MPIGLADSAMTGGGIRGLLPVESGGVICPDEMMKAPALRSGSVYAGVSVSPFTDVSSIASLDEVCSGEKFGECVELTSRSELFLTMEGAVAEKAQWVVAAGAMQCWTGDGGKHTLNFEVRPLS